MPNLCLCYNKSMRFCKLATLVLLGGLFGSLATPITQTTVSALEPGDIVLQVSPAEQEIDLTPSQAYTGSFTVENIGRKAFTFNLSARPYQVSGPNYDPVFTTETSYTTLSTWLTFDQNNLELAPGASAEVTYHVNVPADVPGGGQYAAIIVETRDADDTAAMRIVSQIAVLLYAHVSGEQRLAGSLLDQQLPNFLLGSAFTSVATVENTGNIDFDLTHTLTVTDFFTGRTLVDASTANPDGTPAGRVDQVVLPATTRTSLLTWSGAPALGLFRAHQTLSFLDQTYDLEQVVFLCPVWLVGLLAIFVLLLIVWLILRFRRHRQARRDRLA